MTSVLDGRTARGEVLWAPTPESLGRTHLARYLEWLRAERGLTFADYQELWRWSVDELSGFWQSFADWTGTIWHAQPSEALGSREMPGAQWFVGGTLNYAEHALRSVAARPDVTAVVAHSQTRPPVALSWGELGEAVARCRRGLQRLGVGHGDRVVAYAPNIPETLVAFLAAASLGAIWSSCAPEFGTRAVTDRFAQVEPVVLLAVDGYRYGERDIDRRAEVAAVEAALPTLRATVHVPYLHADGPPADGRTRVTWDELLAEPGPLAFDPVPFDHPLYVLYSSGTTGLPKAIVHGHGGITLEHQKSLRLHHDLGEGNRFLWFTTTGWMMWNLMMSGLLVGATLVLADGDPGYPDLGYLWRLAADTDLDVLGVSAAFVMACRKAGVVPPPNRLRGVGATGSPLPAEGFRWVYDVLGPKVRLVSTSGGTDVSAAFVGSSPWLPVRAGEISGKHLGCDVTAFDPDGEPCPPGVEGELVVTAPMPTMPVGFWGDDDGSRLRAAYFEDYPGVWRHGDWVTFFEDGACIVSGRSDATLNRGGVRLGTGDFYAVVDALPEVDDSLVVYLEGRGDDVKGELLLFVRLAPGAVLDDALRATLAHALRTELSPRHVPDDVLAVPSVPRTLSGKKLEVPVKRLLGGARAEDVASPSSLTDPDALRWFEGYAESRARARREDRRMVEGAAAPGSALVTGCAGFIGSTLAEALAASGTRVVGIDVLTDAYAVDVKRANLAALADVGVEVREADLLDVDLPSLLDGIDVVFHLAGLPGVRTSWGERFADYERMNVLATQRLLEAARNSSIRRLVYSSSSSVYGEAERYPVVETDLLAPRSPYGVTKLAAEHLCNLYAANFGVPTVALRYFTVYGPRQRPDMSFHRIIDAALTGGKFRVFGTGEQRRDFTYVDDAVAANVLAATVDTAPGTVLNVGGGSDASLNEVIALVEATTGRPVARIDEPGAAGDVFRTGADTSRARELLGWQPRTTLQEGIEAQVAWQRELSAVNPAP